MAGPCTARMAPSLSTCLPTRQAAVKAPGACQARRQAPAATGLSGGSSSSGARAVRRQWRRAAADAASAASTVADEAAASSSSKSVPQSDVWELDFCSRPILDERGKKVCVGGRCG